MLFLYSETYLMDSVIRIPFTKTYASVFLDLLRGVAALLVCLFHWRYLLFVDYSQITAYRVPLKYFYLVTSTSRQAVIVFFVLSGYLISSSIFRLERRAAWSWRLYLTHRLVRLWIVLFPALLLGFLWDSMGVHLHLA